MLPDGHVSALMADFMAAMDAGSQSSFVVAKQISSATSTRAASARLRAASCLLLPKVLVALTSAAESCLSASASKSVSTVGLPLFTSSNFGA